MFRRHRPRRQLRRHLQGVECASRIAVGNGLQFVHRLGEHFDVECPCGALDEGRDVIRGQRPQDVYARAGQQRRVDLEGRVLGGCADERNRAPFHVRQESVLLRLVEPMNLVDEQHGSAVGKRLGLGDRLPDLAYAGQHGGKASPLGTGGVREQPRQRGLAGARRTPQDHRVDNPVLGKLAQGPSLVEQMILPDEVAQRTRTHTIRQRTTRRRLVV